MKINCFNLRGWMQQKFKSWANWILQIPWNMALSKLILLISFAIMLFFEKICIQKVWLSSTRKSLSHLKDLVDLNHHSFLLPVFQVALQNRLKNWHGPNSPHLQCSLQILHFQLTYITHVSSSFLLVSQDPECIKRQHMHSLVQEEWRPVDWYIHHTGVQPLVKAVPEL